MTIKERISRIKRIKGILKEFPGQFEAHDDSLYCLWCKEVVNCDRRSTIINHISANKHKPGKGSQYKEFQKFKPEYVAAFVDGFVGSDIPLKKIRSKPLVKLFDFLKIKVPSETTLRRYLLTTHASKIIQDIIELLKNQKIFLIVDETVCLGKRYLNILCGSISKPFTTYLLECKCLETHANSEIIIREVLLTISKLNCPRENFLLLLSDDASYMKKASKELKIIFPNLFTVKCLAHLIHNCSMRLKAEYSNVDSLISSIKGITVKNKTNQQFFETLDPLPNVIVTRWSSWLKAGLYYSSNYSKVKTIVNSLPNDGILMQRAKLAVNNDELFEELISLSKNYKPLIETMDMLESNSLNIESGFRKLQGINLYDDPKNIKNYLLERMKKNDITSIVKYTNKDLEPIVYSDLSKCQATSIAVERSFSQLNNMLTDSRNFKDENILSYFCVIYNSKQFNQ